MRKNKPKLFIQSWEIYPFDILFAFGVSEEALCKHLESLGHELSEKEKELLDCGGKQGRTVMFEGGQTVVRIKGKDLTTQNLPDLVHEIFHATHFLFERLNMKLSMENDEAFAYALAYMMKNVLKKLEK